MRIRRHVQQLLYNRNPGISSFSDTPDGVITYLAPLLDHALLHVPPSLHAETPIFLLATAGMRLLSSSQQAGILKAACDFIRFHSQFRLDKPSAEGPCGSSIRIITGEEEGLFGWIAINYLLDGFVQTDTGAATYGFMDMGGASTQIAFEPTEDQRTKATSLTDVTLRLVNGRDIRHSVFVTTWLGYETNQARERYVSNVVFRQGESEDADDTEVHPSELLDPCLPRGLMLEEGEQDDPSGQPYTLYGTGSFEQCLKDVLPLLNKSAPCPDTPCPINGVHVPHIDFSVSHFIGVSEYWYSSEHVFGLGGAFDFVEFERAASQFCSREWTDILAQHERSRHAGELSDRFESDAETTDTGRQKWSSHVELSRLQMQCFKAAWIVNVLHEGIGLPRIVDPKGNMTSDGGHGDRVMDKAAEKGLGRPPFQSVDAVGDTSISWTLGRIVLEASREITPLPNSSVSSSSKAGSYASEDPVLHLASTSFDFGYHMFSTLLYLATILCLIFAFYRLRFHVTAWACKLYRAVHRHGDNGAFGQSALEEARSPMGRKLSPRMRTATASRSPNLLLSIPASLYRFITSIRGSIATTGLKQERSVLRHVFPSPVRMPPTRSASSPSLRYQYSSGNGYVAGSYPGKPTMPQSTKFSMISDDATMQSSGHLSQSFYTLPRSRNNSQMNLSLVPRQLSSRSSINSGQQTPTGGSFHINE